MYGNGGNDKIDGGTGLDTMYGGTGNDTFYVNHNSDRVRESAGEGSDTVISAGTFTLHASAEIEFLRTSNGAGTGSFILTGNDFAQTITGNAGSNRLNGLEGSDTLSGGGGDDRLDGGTGTDRMTGGSGNDTYVLDNAGDVVIEAAGGGTDIVLLSINWTMAANVEKVSLTGSANINATGNSLSNIMTGNTGNNTLSASAGNDTISAGNGNDKLYGGTGNDRLTGGSGSDTFVFHTAPSSSTNMDTIVDFNVAADTAWLDNAVFTKVGANGGLSSAAFHIGTAAADTSDRVIYNSSTGALIYDSNGFASGGAVQFARLGAGLALTGADFLII